MENEAENEEIGTDDAISTENSTLVGNRTLADVGPSAPVEATSNALIVLPAPSINGEMPAFEWLTVQPPPAGPGAAQGLADHPAALYLARLAPSSRQNMICVLGGVAQTLSAGCHTLWSLPWHQVRYPQMSALRSHLTAAYAPATANLYMTAVCGERLPAGRAVVVGELRALLRACAEDRGPAARRDAALVGVLYGSGLRRAEAAALDLSDLDLAAGSLAVRHGKGNKARQVYLASGGAELLEGWLSVRGQEAGPLFVPVLKSGKLKAGTLKAGTLKAGTLKATKLNGAQSGDEGSGGEKAGAERTGARLAPQSVRYVLQKRARQAGIKDFSPHDLRRTFVGDLLEAGADISTVQKMAGHASVQTTARYDRRGEQAKKKASGLLHIPIG